MPIAFCLVAAALSAPAPAEDASATEPTAAPEARDEGDRILPLRELRIFTEVFNEIRNSYVEEVDDRTLLENAVKGMLNGLDPHSSYLDEEAFGDLRESTTGEFGGIGLEVGMDDGFVRVIAPIDDTPAKTAGIESGDIILRIDGKPVKGMDLIEAINLMRGAKGTSIELTIAREGNPQPLEFKLVRDVIRVRSVRQRLLGDGFGYLRIAQFQNETGQDVEKALEKLDADNGGALRGLVLDLRNNPGGLLQASVDVADDFLEEGTIVSTRGRVANADSSYAAEAGDLLQGAPIVVLINGGSASASEIVAGALQDHRRAVIVGTTSFGKGSVQTVLPLGEDQGIKLTTARYYTPSGRSIQAHGIEPDIVVERAEVKAVEGFGSISEADLNRHLVNGDEAGEDDKADSGRKAKKNPGRELRSRDNQLYEALNLLKGIVLTKGE